MAKIFLNYRINDSRDKTDIIYETLKSKFGKESIFKDSRDIAPGVKWEAKIKRELSLSGIVFVIVGENWLSEFAKRKSENSRDWVLWEISTAIQMGKTILVVLVDNAEFPKKEEIPKEIQEIYDYQIALTVRDGSYQEDDLDKIVQITEEELRALPQFPLPEKVKTPKIPYKGLNFFKREDSKIFFGRSLQILDLLEYVEDEEIYITLYYGQTGVGKSSLLQAGFIPRLENRWKTKIWYIPRIEGTGLHQQLKEASAEFPGNEKTLIVLDQVEGIYTGQKIDAEESNLVKEIIRAKEVNPNLRFILSFRKEWVADIEKALESAGLEFNQDYQELYLTPLTRDQIVEAITGPIKIRKYNLKIDNDAVDQIANDLYDKDSHLAPLLQIQLRKLWDIAFEKDKRNVHITLDTYESIKTTSLKSWYKTSLKEITLKFNEYILSGLAVDVLWFYTHNGASIERTDSELTEKYSHIANIVEFKNALKDKLLLTEPNEENNNLTRIAHDTLAKIIQNEYYISVLPGQRSTRILSNAIENKVALRKQELEVVINGEFGREKYSNVEKQLIDESIQTFSLELARDLFNGNRIEEGIKYLKVYFSLMDPYKINDVRLLESQFNTLNLSTNVTYDEALSRQNERIINSLIELCRDKQETYEPKIKFEIEELIDIAKLESIIRAIVNKTQDEHEKIVNLVIEKLNFQIRNLKEILEKEEHLSETDKITEFNIIWFRLLWLNDKLLNNKTQNINPVVQTFLIEDEIDTIRTIFENSTDLKYKLNLLYDFSNSYVINVGEIESTILLQRLNKLFREKMLHLIDQIDYQTEWGKINKASIFLLTEIEQAVEGFFTETKINNFLMSEIEQGVADKTELTDLFSKFKSLLNWGNFQISNDIIRLEATFHYTKSHQTSSEEQHAVTVNNIYTALQFLLEEIKAANQRNSNLIEIINDKDIDSIIEQIFEFTEFNKLEEAFILLKKCLKSGMFEKYYYDIYALGIRIRSINTQKLVSHSEIFAKQSEEEKVRFNLMDMCYDMISANNSVALLTDGKQTLSKEVIEAFLQLLKEDRLEELFALLRSNYDYLKRDSLIQIRLLKARFLKIERRRMLNLVSYKNYILEKNNINHQLLKVILNLNKNYGRVYHLISRTYEYHKIAQLETLETIQDKFSELKSEIRFNAFNLNDEVNKYTSLVSDCLAIIENGAIPPPNQLNLAITKKTGLDIIKVFVQGDLEKLIDIMDKYLQGFNINIQAKFLAFFSYMHYTNILLSSGIIERVNEKVLIARIIPGTFDELFSFLSKELYALASASDDSNLDQSGVSSSMINTYIQDNDFDKAVQLLLANFVSSNQLELFTESLLLKSSLNESKKAFLLGLIDSKQYDLEMNRISVWLIELKKELDAYL